MAPAASVSVRLPLPGAPILDADKVAVTPLGTPLTDSTIGALKPVPAAVVTMIGKDPPRARLPLDALSENVYIPVTVRLRV